MSAQPPTIGMPCTGSCMGGLICASSGPFARQCTASCNNAAACQVLVSGNAQCYGSAAPQCGLPCTTGMECPEGTSCQVVEGAMACKLAVP